MNRIKTIAVVLSVAASAVTAAPLRDGRYFLQSDVLPDGLCTVTSTNERSRLVHHESHFPTIINLKSAWRGKIKIVDTTIPTQEFSISVSGSARPQRDGSFSGSVKQVSYFIPLIPGKTSKGKWSLRRATKEDIAAGIDRTLKAATENLWSNRGIPKKYNKAPELSALRSAAFLPEVIEMYEAGTIVVKNGNFRLNDTDSQQPDGAATQESAPSAAP